MRRTVALAALLLSVAAPAAAQDRPAEVTTYDFMDDLVSGTHYDPGGEILTAHRRTGHRSLIRARAHFIPELTQTVENL